MYRYTLLALTLALSNAVQINAPTMTSDDIDEPGRPEMDTSRYLTMKAQITSEDEPEFFNAPMFNERFAGASG